MIILTKEQAYEVLKNLHQVKRTYWDSYRWDLCRIYDGEEMVKVVEKRFQDFTNLLNFIEKELMKIKEKEIQNEQTNNR